MVFKLFWVAADLELFGSTAAHLELLHQIYSSAFTLLVKNFSLKHCYLEETRRVARKLQWGAVFGVWGRGTEVIGAEPPTLEILSFLAKIT